MNQTNTEDNIESQKSIKKFSQNATHTHTFGGTLAYACDKMGLVHEALVLLLLIQRRQKRRENNTTNH